MKPARLQSLFLFLSIVLVRAQGVAVPESGRPIIRSFGAAEGHSKGPVLAFAETEDGTLFVGSNYLVVFDGFRWQRIEIAGAYGFRALATAADPNRVWVWATGAIGYVQRDDTGIWTFVSMAPQLAASNLPVPGEISLVRPVGAGAVFVGTQEVLRWDGTKFVSWSLKSAARLRGAGDRQHVWVIQQGTGLWAIGEAGEPTLALPASLLPAGSAEWVIPPPDAKGADTSLEGMLLGLDTGVFRRSAGRWVRLDEISNRLDEETPAFAADVGPDEFVVGTLNDGVFLARKDGSVEITVNHGNGLSDDAVCSLWGDRRRGIWVGLNDGCCRLDSLGAISIYDRREGLDLGLPRKVFAEGDTRFVLTDRVLYRLRPGGLTGHLDSLVQAGDRLSDALPVGNSVWLSGQSGLRSIGGQPITITHSPTGVIAADPSSPGGLLFAEGAALNAAAPHSTPPWEERTLQFKAGSDVSSIVTAADGRVWLSADGLYELGPSPAQGTAPVAHFLEGQGLPTPSAHPILATLGDAVFAFTETQVLRFQPTSSTFEPEPALAGWTVAGAASNLAPAADGYWLVQRSGLSDVSPYDILRVHETDGHLAFESMRVAGLDNLGDITSMNLLDSPGGPVLWVGGKGGLLRIEVAKIRVASAPRHLQLRQIHTSGDAERFLEIHPSRPVELSPDTRRVEFAFSAAQPMEASPQAVNYQTQLLGIENEWSVPSHKNTREFTGLAPGRYVFMARRVDRHGVPGEALSYPFAVIAPFYARWPAILAYAVTLLALGILILRWRLRQLREQTERLDRLVKSRTRELELSNTAKSEFLETISHEIRNPLNGIVGLAGLLKPENLDPEEADVARSLQASAEHLRRVAEDVLGFSRLELGVVSVDHTPFRLRRLLEELLAAARDQAQRQGNPLTLSVPEGDDDRFAGDPQKIRTIIGNFLTNALNHAPGVPIELKADWAHDGAKERQVFIAVIDRGPGVTAEDQELIFQKFVRGRAATENRVTGSGLGLALCRTLAQSMGGAVGLESPPPGGPVGSSFYLWLPLQVSTAPALEPLSAEATAELGALVVDDQDYNRAVLVGLSRELGFTAHAAGDVGTALALMEQHPIAVAFLDLELRGGDGCTLARRIREIPKNSQAIIIAVTGHDSAEARARCTAAGMDGFLLKPVLPDDVRTVISQARRGPWRALDLYTQSGAGTREEAGLRLLESLDDEATTIRSGDRAAKRAAAHRLRALGALVHDTAVNEAAARLQAEALEATEERLLALAETAVNEVSRLRVALLRSGVGAARRGRTR